jgi:hypothetical protein
MDQMLTLFKDTFLELKSVGDEIGIHIHTWKWNFELSRWTQTTIPEEETEIVFDSVKLFQKKTGLCTTLRQNGLEYDEQRNNESIRCKRVDS